MELAKKRMNKLVIPIEKLDILGIQGRRLEQETKEVMSTIHGLPEEQARKIAKMKIEERDRSRAWLDREFELVIKTAEKLARKRGKKARVTKNDLEAAWATV